MPFFGTVTKRHFRKKKSKPQKYIQMTQRFLGTTFFRKSRSVMAQRFGFFSGFTDKG